MVSHTKFINKTGNIQGLPYGRLIIVLLEFVEKSLPDFSKKYINSNIRNEKSLNYELTDYLNIKVADIKIPVFFREYMENPQIGNSPQVDVGTIRTDFYTGKSIFSLEAKRLDNISKAREKEYVVGRFEKNKYIDSGGIERFKKNIHGQGLKHCGMIGYVQKKDFKYWHKKINSWIDELIKDKSHNLKWDSKDKLVKDYEKSVTAKYTSKHSRLKDGPINLTHLWVLLAANPQ